MSMLPRIDSPTFNIKLPVSKVDIKIRPYTVKEQKILLMAYVIINVFARWHDSSFLFFK